MVFKLTQQAQGRWRRINAPHLMQHVAAGVTSVNGEAVDGNGETANLPNDAQTLETAKEITREKNVA
jgi:hypothetical protein